MTRTELLELIANGENSGVEFKRDDIRSEQFAKEVVSFLNLQGGRVLLGVEDDGSITGCQREDCQEWVLNIFRDKIFPQTIPFYEEVQVDDHRRVAVVTVGAGISKPYMLKHNQREEIYIRMGDRSELASREQQLRLFESGGLLHVEVLPVAGTSFSTLDRHRLHFYLAEILKDPDVPHTDEGWVNRLLGLGLMAKDSLGNKVCSIAGLLCFGADPRRFLPQSGIRLMVFSGTDKVYKADFDEILRGPLVARWRLDPYGSKELDQPGLIEKLAEKLRPYLSHEGGEVDTQMRRESTWDYPWDAIREGVINALVHRDWTRSVDIEIVCYSDRIEIISPGKLQNSMTIEKMIAGQRSPRNPLIADILRDHGYVDARGMGVRTKIIPLMKAQNGTIPEFEATEDFLALTLHKRQSAQ